MYIKMMAIVAVFALATLVSGGASQAQAQARDGWEARAVVGVAHYRAAVLGDTTAEFEACRLGRDARVALAERMPAMLRPCTGSRPPRANWHAVLLDSVTHQPDGFRVFVTVIRGEWEHREDYTMVATETGPYMPVREVRLWGAFQVYPRQPGPAGEHP